MTSENEYMLLLLLISVQGGQGPTKKMRSQHYLKTPPDILNPRVFPCSQRQLCNCFLNGMSENEASVTKLASPTNQILVPAHLVNPHLNPKNPKSHLKIWNRNQQTP